MHLSCYYEIILDLEVEKLLQIPFYPSPRLSKYFAIIPLFLSDIMPPPLNTLIHLS